MHLSSVAISDVSGAQAATDSVKPLYEEDRAAETRFVSLDLLRGGAALVVAVGHFTGLIPAYLAVDFFLVLSGFILSHRYLYGQRVNFRQFVVARLARLYPLHLLTLLAFALIYLLRFRSAPDYADGTVATFFAHVSLLQNVGLTTSELTWNAPSWSISVELWVNIVFFALISRRTPSWLLATAAVASLAYITAVDGTLAVSLHNYFGFLNSGLLRGFASFLLGVVAYRAHLQWSQRQGASAGIIVAARALLLALSIAFMTVPLSETRELEFFAPFVFAACVVLFAVDSQRWMHWLRPLSHLGTISYSVYLIHYPLLYFIRYLKEFAVGTRADSLWVSVVNDTFGRFILYIGLTLALAHLTFLWFERPSRKMLRRSLG